MEVIPELKQQITELQRHRHELETQLEEQRTEMTGELFTGKTLLHYSHDYLLFLFFSICLTENNIRVSNELQRKLDEERSQNR